VNVRGLLASPLGFLIGISLGALGGGGSVLAVPALVYVAGQSPKAATTTSLLVVGVTALGGMVAHLRAGRVRVGAGTLFGLAGVGGSLLGSSLNDAVDENVLLLAFSGLMVVAAWRMCSKECRRAMAAEVDPARLDPVGRGADRPAVELRPPGAELEPGPLLAPSRPALVLSPSVALRFLVAGSIVGLLTGFFGVGGGFIVVPALVLALHFDMPDAVGTSLLIIAINSAVALALRVGTTGVEWAVAVPFTIAGLLGVSVGKRLADRLPTRTLVRWFVILLVTVAAYTAVNSILALWGPTG
jgi:uncharacterized membrane protein YfcA